MYSQRRSKEQIQADIEAGSKVCCVCGERKDFNEFYRTKNKNDGRLSRCIVCDKLAGVESRKRDPSRASRVSRRKTLRYKYNLSEQEYDILLAKQGGVCALCGKAQPEVPSRKEHSLSVDHCHTTGVIRGLLCNQCNRGLGMLGDTEAALSRAIEYLRRYDE